MLVIDLIVGALLDHCSQIRLLEHKYAVIREQVRDAASDLVDVGDVANHVGGDDRIGRTILVTNLARQFQVKKGHFGPNAMPRGLGGNVGRRFDAEVADAASREIFEHRAVIAANLDDKRIVALQKAIANPFRIFSKMLNHAPGRAGEEGITLVKHLMRIRLIDDLEAAAFDAESRRQIVKIFVIKMRGCQERIGNRHASEPHERLDG